ncbi:MAG TPA: relaxase domain-containing protein [Acidimicrobiales bacterium]|nr:relaxase domain-containing protein [Acidimicrobiales bacterium]
MLRVFVRRSSDVRYFTEDRALEIEDLRDGPAGWWLRGEGDATSERDVAGVLTSTKRSQVVGYDLVFAAPRPLSMLLALHPDHGSALVNAQRRSVRAAMSYLEEHALVVRDRRSAEDRDVAARWESAVGFTHGVNRHGDPHLHDHVLVGARPADVELVLDARALYAHSRAADALYRTSLRYEVARRTPFQAQRTFHGVEVVAGLDEGYRALWGGRHEARGEKRLWQRHEIVERWRSDLERFQPFGGGVERTRASSQLDEHRFGSSLEGRREVGRRHLVEAWSDAAITGHDPREVRASIESLYPELGSNRGVRETMIGVRQARQTQLVSERGARPLAYAELDAWRQRSRERSREGRSR